MSQAEPPTPSQIIEIRRRASTLLQAGWAPEAAQLLRSLIGSGAETEPSFRIDLTRMLLAAGDLAGAERIRIDGPLFDPAPNPDGDPE